MPRISTAPYVSAYGIRAAALALLTAAAPAASQNFPPQARRTELGIQTSTNHRPKPDGFVGPEVCAGCHPSEAASQMKTPMADAATRAAHSAILRDHPDMAVRMGGYVYRIKSTTSGITYSVTDGSQIISVPILLAFGNGAIGQTFVFWRNGVYYEARVSYFTSLNGLDLTIGHSSAPPPSVEEASGRRMQPGETRACFSCHFTGAVVDGRLDVAEMLPGVSCEDCHGPGKQHVEAVKVGDLRSGAIFNPGRLSPAGLVRSCGACHRTLEDVRALGLRGVVTVRFQPYRLALSRCWNPNDGRITCVACHDPHEAIRHDVSYYDSKCLACHVSGPGSRPTSAQPGPACPVGARNCVTCHMPQGELPGSHAIFTDHDIRVALPNAPFPD